MATRVRIALHIQKSMPASLCLTGLASTVFAALQTPVWSANPLVVVRLLFWGMIASAVLFLASDRYCNATLRRHWRLLCLVLFLTILWRLPSDGRFFHGLEYEDAYVYAAAARQTFPAPVTNAPGSDTYLTTVCAVGSVESCRQPETYSGHFIGAPYVISLATDLFGYTPEVGSLVSLSAACCSVMLIFLIGRLLLNTATASVCAGFVFALTPVFAVNGIAAFAEPLSNTCVGLALLAYLRYIHSPPTGEITLRQTAAWCAFFFALLFSLVVKRENIVVAIALPLITLLRANLGRWPAATPSRLRWVLLSSLVAAVFAVDQMQLGQVVAAETAEFGRIPFALREAAVLVPMFAASFTYISWYCGGAVLVALGAICAIRRRSRSLYPLLLLLCYLVLYTSHIRSYYQFNYGDVSPYDALRYSMNCMTLWALLAGCGMTVLISAGRHLVIPERWRWCVATAKGMAVVVAVAISYWYTARLRSELTDSESMVRIEPAQAACRLAVSLGVSRTYILTAEPLLIQIFGPPMVNVIDLTQVRKETVDALEFERRDLVLLYLDHATYQNDVDRKRFEGGLDVLRGFSKEIEQSGDRYVIWRLRRGVQT